MLFLDHRGTIYHLDLERATSKHLLKEGAIVIADNVLAPGAPEFLWYLSKTSSAVWFRTLILELMEFGKPMLEDWIVVCRYITQEWEEVTANITSNERPPPKVRNLACIVDSLAWQSQVEQFPVTTWQFHVEQLEFRLKE